MDGKPELERSELAEIPDDELDATIKEYETYAKGLIKTQNPAAIELAIRIENIIKEAKQEVVRRSNNKLN